MIEEKETLTAKVREKAYEVVYKQTKEEKFFTAWHCYSYDEAVKEFKEHQKNNNYYLSIREIIVIENTIKEEYHEDIVNNYREEIG
jgi:hypothetical protein